MSNGIELLCDGHHGIYIPQIMARSLHDAGWSIDPDDVAVCDAGPDNFDYWETWDQIIDYAEYTDENGNIWRLYQDGDLWTYCDELMTEEEKYSFFGDF